MISTGEIVVEVKDGSMVFDFSLIIVSTNIGPDDMAKACGLDKEEAMFWRFTDTVGLTRSRTELHVVRNNLIEHLVKIIAKQVDICDRASEKGPSGHKLHLITKQ